VIRQHDVQILSEDSAVLAEGTFRVVLTRGRRVVTAIDIPDSALGPLHLVFAVSPQSTTPSTFATGSVFGGIGRAFGHVAHDVGHDLSDAAEGTFNAASKVATTVARPAFDLTRDAAAAGASLIAHVPLVSDSEKAKLEAASRTVMRARLGDVNAQQFIHAIGQAAKAGVKEAQRAGDALLTGTRIVDHVLDAPMRLLEKIPGVGGVVRAVDPFVQLDQMTGAIQRGDFAGLKNILEGDVKMAAGVIAWLPGVGTGVSAAVNAGLAVLDGGGPIDVAIHAAYGAIPIPPGLREATDAVVDGVLGLLRHGSLTDAAIASARNAAPAGLPRDVFDTLVKIVIRHRPIAHVAEDLVGTYVKRYAPEIHVPESVGIHASGVVHLDGGAGAAMDFAARQFGSRGGSHPGQTTGPVVSLFGAPTPPPAAAHPGPPVPGGSSDIPVADARRAIPLGAGAVAGAGLVAPHLQLPVATSAPSSALALARPA
jgi:hypothetical protein